MNEIQGRERVVIAGVKPEIDGGAFPIKRTVGGKVVVEADIFTDGHDAIHAVLLYRNARASEWLEMPMQPLVDDRWQGTFAVTEMGRYVYSLMAWVDAFASWRLAMGKKLLAAQDIAVDLLIGAQLIEDASRRAGAQEAEKLQCVAAVLRAGTASDAERTSLALGDDIAALMARNADRSTAVSYPKALAVVVDREKARFSAWYEMFPRSTSPVPALHGTFKDCEARLSYIAEMGFDVLYLPPIHPIGRTNRKGKNNTLMPLPDDVGVPWAIGASEGGHRAIHPQLGSLDDFRRFVRQAKSHGLDVALDMAFQCSPDHPYISQYPAWFRWRPDGRVQYAENPPKRYEDIYPFEFDNNDWQGLWEELTGVVVFWIEQGVNIFRVDNPHTKPFRFWEYLIGQVKQKHPEVIFLAEAFTRPKIMYNLAKLGFTQSYTYFAWRNTKWELTQYLTELTQTEVKEFFRPNFWPNTPDILNEYLQFGGRPAFMTRLILAATLAANYGIYGPAFELCENTPREPGSEEYLDSEKYQLRHWAIDRTDSLKGLITRVNRIRRQNPALHDNNNLQFHAVTNEEIICYSKHTEDCSNIILVVVNVDSHHTQSGWVTLDFEALGLEPDESYQVHDLLGDARYLWHGSQNYVELNPEAMPAQIFQVRRHARTERDFDYFL